MAKKNDVTPLAAALVQRHGEHYKDSLHEPANIYDAALQAVEGARSNPNLSQAGQRDALMKALKTSHAQLKKYDEATSAVDSRLAIAKSNALPRVDMSPSAVALRREVRDRIQGMSHAELGGLYLQAVRDQRLLVVQAIDENPMGPLVTDDIRDTAQKLMRDAVKDPEVAALTECVGLRDSVSTSARIRMQELAAESGISWADVEQR